MAPLDRTRVTDLVGLIKTELENVGPAPAVSAGYDDFRAHQAKYRRIVDKLIAYEGATYRDGKSAPTLRLAGVSTSCTGGDAGLLRNWINAAERHCQSRQVA